MIQRLRVKFGRGEEVKFISHLDIMRFWERALRRARIPLSYSQGFSPHPHISIAAPLAVGVTSEAELMDVWLKYWMPPQSFMVRVKNHLPRGFEIFDVWEVGLNMPSLQSSVTFAEYYVDVESEEKVHDIQNSLRSLLQVRELPWHHLRGDKEHFYDLRALIDNVWLIESQQPVNHFVLGMKLRCDNRGSGRPDQVIAALGLSKHPNSIHRTKLLIDNSRR